MADNVLETVQKLVQDVIAPDVRELKARLEGFEHRVDDRFKSVDEKFKALEQRMDDRFAGVDEKFKALEQRMDDRFAGVDLKFAGVDQKFAAADQKLEFQIGKVLAAIAALRAENDLAAVREVSSLRERVAVLELQQKQSQRAA